MVHGRLRHKQLLWMCLVTVALLLGCSHRATTDESIDLDSKNAQPSGTSNRAKPKNDESAVLKKTTPIQNPSEFRAELTALGREQLDATVWADEVRAQAFERPFTRLWDELRSARDPWAVLLDAVAPRIRLGNATSAEDLDLGIRRIRFGAPERDFTKSEFVAIVERFRSQGFQLVESEWHHARFEPTGPASEFDFVLHVQRPQTVNTKELRAIIRGTLAIDWLEPTRGAKADKSVASVQAGDRSGLSPHKIRPVAQAMRAQDVEILTRSGPPVFERVFTYSRRKNDVSSAHPILLCDLDRNGFDDIVISRWNRVYLNSGKGQFTERRFLAHCEPHGETGVLADFDRDGSVDFLTVAKSGKMILFRGDSEGKFLTKRDVVAETSFVAPLAVTVGDIDSDGDLDVWQTQYRLSYVDGHMPTPYYNANDGFPASLLRNDGTGEFTDVTATSGLAAKRFRRTYSTSFVDLDDDGDLDLIVVSDFAGLDAYRNDGSGHFTDATESLFGESHLFGMSHTMADYNLDGRLDLYAIGMSSTTARRLDRLDLGRHDRPEVHRMRAAMGYGNRMFLKPADPANHPYSTPEFARSVARTGWSWGTSSFDFDNDGDSDIYVANGFRSGKSSQDYCTRFWCHDIYTGTSEPNPTVKSILAESLRDLDRGQISWNGYEHNALLVNLDGKDFVNAGFLMGVACEFDSRAVTTNDLDGDGNVDLLVTEYEFDGKGFVMDLHVYRNTLTSNNGWIGIRLENQAIGTTVRINSGDQHQLATVMTGDSFGSQAATQVHFGLGKGAVDSIEVVSPNGDVTRIDDPPIGRYHTIPQR